MLLESEHMKKYLDFSNEAIRCCIELEEVRLERKLNEKEIQQIITHFHSLENLEE